MVKGLSRRVIVIKSPDARYFDEAIFVLKDEIFAAGKDSNAILKQARKVANSYVQPAPPQLKKSGTKFPPKLFILLGALTPALALIRDAATF